MAGDGGGDLLMTVREDDYVEFYIFPIINGNETEDTLLSKYLVDITNLLQVHLKQYIWHKDEFSLTIRRKNSYMLSSEIEENLPAHLYGVLHYGDNIEDEWFVTFLLHQVSVHFSELVIRVVDSDAEFLLIEAANYLPSWADPETCDKRVYLHKGKIHIIPFSELDSNEDVSVSEAIEIVKTKSLLTEASTPIQDAILNRINAYPDKIKENLHHAKLYLPVGIAAILNHRPGLISHAVTAFCNRDPIDVRACRAMKYFPPENRVYSRVKFTKCLYAMLLNSNYVPDSKIGWNLPTPTRKEYKSHLLGIKVACGFEILASHAKPLEEMEKDPKWIQYLESLKQKNYFKGLLEHSTEYNQLLNTAKDYFKNNRDMMHFNPVLGSQIIELNRSLDYCVEDLKKLEMTIPEDDNENWLKLDPQELDRMLQEQYGTSEANSNQVVRKLNEFLESASGIEGVEFPSEKESPVRPKRGVKKNKKGGTDTTDSKINFDPSNFSCAVQNILDLMIPEDNWDLESGSEMSDYGDEPEMDLEKSEGVNKLKDYMEAMDRELATTCVRKEDKFDDIESFKPVDIDMTVLKNVIESYESQMGGSGPITNMLGPMGVHLEKQSSSKQPNT